jgi:uncharacterized protein
MIYVKESFPRAAYCGVNKGFANTQGEHDMEIRANTKLQELLKPYPFLLEFFLNRSPNYQMLKSAVVRKTVGNVAPLAHIAERGGIPLEQLMGEIAAAVQAQTGHELTIVLEQPQQASPLVGAEARQAALKDIIRDLHAGIDMKDLKARFHALIRDIDAAEIARMEQRLIAEGMPQSEIKRLCDVHVELFKESLETQQRPTAPAGHPISTYMLENRVAEEISAQIARALEENGGADALLPLIARLSDINRHYLRKENQLFPVLEQHEITGPSEVMWAIHDDIRQGFKRARTAIASLDQQEIKALLQAIDDMVYKEEHILFPMALELLSEADWAKVRHGEEEIGYAWVTPEAGWAYQVPAGATGSAACGALPREIQLDTGSLSPELLNLMLMHLPVDLSFVNERDEIMYYSQTKERIFPRSPGVIGRKVQNCHPPKSMDTVQKILDSFRAGTRDSAEFWIQMGGRFVHIRYFAVRDAIGSYRGCLEVSQDVTSIRALEGERRLLDWD